MRNGRLGVGIVGCGEISVAHHKAYSQLPDHVELVALSDVVEATAQRRAQEFGVDTVHGDYHELLADPKVDVVAICTPHYLHAPIAIAAANAGKHVLVEKPMCMNVGEVNEMIQAARRNNVKLTMSTEVVNPYHIFMKERVLPEIGPISFSYLIDFYFRAVPYYEKARWRGTWDREGGGIFVNQAIYTWDVYQWYLGGVDTAYGYWTNLLHPNVEVEDTGYGVVRFKNGTLGKLLATSVCEAPPGTRWMSIQGARGEIFSIEPWLYKIDFQLQDKAREAELRRQMADYIASLKGPGHDISWDDPALSQVHWRRVLLQMRDIVEAVREGRDVTVSPESCGEAMKILNGIHWTGWNHADAFQKWAYLNFEMPRPTGREPLPTADDAMKTAWHGGKLFEQLVAIVKDPSPSLAAPFLLEHSAAPAALAATTHWEAAL
jgi:predicted dehydrogenase